MIRNYGSISRGVSMQGLRAAPAVLTSLIVACLSVLTGCYGNSKDLLARDDLLALRTIYNTSSGTFHSSEIDVRVFRGGSVDIHLHGNLTPKQEIEGDVWIPVLLLHKLPSYFHVIQPDASAPVTLEAYEFKSGMWCIAAVFPLALEGTRTAHSENGDESSRLTPRAVDAKGAVDSPEEQYRSVQAALSRKLASGPLDFRIGLASEELQESLPFSIPSDPSGESTSISVELPTGASFSDDTSSVAANVVRGWQSGELEHSFESFRSSQAVTTQNLTPVFEPASAGLKRAGTLNFPDAVAWDFSKIDFYQPGVLSQFHVWFLPSALTLILLACAAWFRIYRLVPLVSGIHGLTLTLSDQARELERWLHRSSEMEAVDASWNDWARLELDLRQSLATIGTPLWSGSISSIGIEMLSRLAQRLNQFEKKFADSPNIEGYKRKGPGFESPSSRLAGLRHTTDLLIKEYRRYRLATTILWIIGFGVLVGLVVMLATFAKAQSRFQNPPNLQLSLPILCDLDVALAPHDLTKLGEKFDVSVRFSPLTGDPRQTDSTIRFGTGNAQGVTIDPVEPLSNPQVSIVQQSETQVTLRVPLHYSPLVRRINAISQWTEQIKVPNGYPSTINKANHLNFSYTLQGAAKPYLLSSSGRHWLYLFPFDGADIEIPLDMEQALLFRLGLAKPANDYFADVTIAGAALTLTESENGDHYDFVNTDTSLRLPISAHGGIVLRAKFQRNAFQRWGLTIGVAILSILVGICGGWFTTLSDKDWKGYLYTTLGLGTLVFGVRAAVLAAYKDLPTLMTGQGTTIFEIVYVGCIVVMIVTVIITRRALTP
jgi:hypothetical protein